MLTPEGTVTPHHERSEKIVKDRDYYSDLPSVDAVEAMIDSILASAMNADEVVLEPGIESPSIPEIQSMAYYEMNDFHE